ncbi:transmembrane emp24 domain-containing protein 1-like isoform X2 [Amphiura filiformis]|uniref:transmembrane emp24 domain-containing protein 1-like isoform X2 n=1 Tax=Amphiura filiformis TaxID=82378 RepID=UPI003B22517F
MVITLISNIVIILTLLLGFCLSIEHDLTIIVPAGRRECFNQHIREGQTFDFEFQVIEGGDMDINFILRTPSNRAMATEARKQEGIYTYDTKETGEYLFCFDNSFSRMSEKIVYFDIELDYDDQDEEVNSPAWFDMAGTLQEYDISIDEIQTSLDIVKEHLRKAQQHQRMWRNIEFRDRYVAERNYERVAFWSILTCVVMITTFIVQVFMIRSLFSGTGKVRT